MTPRGTNIQRALAAREALGEKIGRKRALPWAEIQRLSDEGLSDYMISRRLLVGAGAVRYITKAYKAEKLVKELERAQPTKAKDDSLPVGWLSKGLT